MRYLNPCAKTIGWADFTWNPVTGCKNGCEYCYARRMAKRFHQDFKPAFHPERLDTPSRLKKPSRIFVCSNADLFGEWVPAEWIESVLKVCGKNPQHKFLFLTKNPVRYRGFLYPQNCWVGATITSYYDRNKLVQLFSYEGSRTFISVEPLLGDPVLDWVSHYHFKWIIIGAQTPYSAKTAPKPEWVQSIISFARKYETPLYLKNSLRWPETIKEFPEWLKLGGAEAGAPADVSGRG